MVGSMRRNPGRVEVRARPSWRDNEWHWRKRQRAGNEQFNVLKFKKSMCVYLAILTGMSSCLVR